MTSFKLRSERTIKGSKQITLLSANGDGLTPDQSFKLFCLKGGGSANQVREKGEQKNRYDSVIRVAGSCGQKNVTTKQLRPSAKKPVTTVTKPSGGKIDKPGTTAAAKPKTAVKMVTRVGPESPQPRKPVLNEPHCRWRSTDTGGS